MSTACTGGDPDGGSPGGGTIGGGPNGGEGPSGSISAGDFDTVNFDAPTAVDNMWFPLQPGMKYVYQGAAEGGKRTSRRRVVMIVTDLTKEVMGVPNVAIWERDYSDGELAENELAFFAQDNSGNIWHFGEYPEEYENGKIVDNPAWFAGLDGAKTGITIKADPQLGGPSYSQGYAPPPIDWADRARVYQMGQQTCVPVTCYENVLVTEEFERAKPGSFQLKFYAPEVGTVAVGWRGRNEKERETLELVEIRRLGSEELAKLREQVLAIEARAYEISPDVYGQTTPLDVSTP